jgi:hypothetical protein
MFTDNNILELKNLLIKCQYLVGLYLINYNEFDVNNLFRILDQLVCLNLNLIFDQLNKIFKIIF